MLDALPLTSVASWPLFTASSRSAASRADRLAVGVLLLVAALALLTFRDYGLGWDDYAHAQYGALLLKLYGSGFADRRALSFVNLFMYGGGFDMASALAAKVLPFDLFETRRLVGAAVGILGLFVTWRLARRMGGPLAGLLALVLLAASPDYYGHMYMNPKDGPFAVAMIILLLGLVRTFDEYPSPSRRTVVLFGTGLGAALGSRILGGLAALYAAPALLLIVITEAHVAGLRAALQRAGQFVLTLGPGLGLGYLIMGFIWPWSIVEPLNPIRALSYFSVFFEKPWKELFEGALIPVPEMPWTYLPTLLAFKLPEVLSLSALAGIAAALGYAFRTKHPLPRRAVLLLVALAPVVPIAVALTTHPALYNGIRHFEFLMPPFAVLGGLGAAFLFDRVRRFGLLPAAAATAAWMLAIALPIVEMVRLHPYQYAYFNTLSGGLRHADDLFMLDYWGLSFKQASAQLLEKLRERHETPPAGRPWKIAVCGPHPPAEVWLGPQFKATWDSKGADFAMMLGEFYCARLDAPILADIEREGVVFARVYDIRGRDVPNILTIPPP